MDCHACINFTLIPNLGIPFTWQELTRPGARHRMLLLDLENVVPFLGEQFGLELKAFLETEWHSVSLGEQCLLKAAALRCGCFLHPPSSHLCISPCIQGRRQPQGSHVAHPGIHGSFYINGQSFPTQRSDSGLNWIFL